MAPWCVQPGLLVPSFPTCVGSSCAPWALPRSGRGAECGSIPQTRHPAEAPLASLLSLPPAWVHGACLRVRSRGDLLLSAHLGRLVKYDSTPLFGAVSTAACCNVVPCCALLPDRAGALLVPSLRSKNPRGSCSVPHLRGVLLYQEFLPSNLFPPWDEVACQGSFSLSHLWD